VSCLKNSIHKKLNSPQPNLTHPSRAGVKPAPTAFQLTRLVGAGLSPPDYRAVNFLFLPPQGKSVQLVIPAKSGKAGCEPGGESRSHMRFAFQIPFDRVSNNDRICCFVGSFTTARSPCKKSKDSPSPQSPPAGGGESYLSNSLTGVPKSSRPVR
jgi:hypothetical protein